MNRRKWLLAFAAHSRQRDICIYDSSAVGITAADITAPIQARKMGRTVFLMEPGGHLGRITVEGLGSSDIDNHWFGNSLAAGGLAKNSIPASGPPAASQAPSTSSHRRSPRRCYSL